MSFNRGRKIALAVALSMILLGLGAFGYSLSMEAYKNEALYEMRYMEIQSESTPENSTSDATKKFHELRAEHLTPKHKIQDYSMSIAILGAVASVLVLLGGREITAFKKKRNILFLGILAPILTSMATYADLALDYTRGEFPWWADSLAIPIATEIPLFSVLLIWALSHALFLRGNYVPGQKIWRLEVAKSNYWLMATTIFSIVLMASDLYAGQFLMIVPSCIWMYYYLSLAAGRRKLQTGTP